MSETVRVSEVDGVGWITLNRPEAMNAITVELGAALEQALAELADRARVVVIRGAGGNFCVGGDFKELQELRSRGEGAMRDLFANFGRACASIARLRIPVVAAVEGYAMAGGFELMQACDVAMVTDEATLADNHSNFGQVPGGGGSQRLPRLVGRQRALGHILTGDRLSGAEAATWGLAYRSVPAAEFDTAIEALAAQLARKDPDALRRAKRLVYDGLERPLEDGLALELQTVLAHLRDSSAGAGI